MWFLFLCVEVRGPFLEFAVFAMWLCSLNVMCCLPDGKMSCKLEGWVLLQKGLDKQKAKARRSSPTSHTSHRKSHKAKAAHWSQPKTPRRIQLALPCLAWSSSRLRSLFSRKCLRATRRPAFDFEAIFVLSAAAAFSLPLPLLT